MTGKAQAGRKRSPASRRVKSTPLVPDQSPPVQEIAPPAQPLCKLLDEVVTLLTRHVMLPEGASEAVALWVAHTHAFDAAQITPRLFITSPEKQSGKSSLMILVEHLVRNPRYLSSISGSGIFRTIEAVHPTLLIDEADNSVAKNDDTTAVLNSGHSRGGKALRLVGPNYVPKEFSTCAPVAIAGIGRLRDTLEDRSIIIQMRRWQRHERRQRVRRDRMENALAISKKLEDWAKASLRDLTAMDDPFVPDELSDRAADNWRPLFSIADLAGGNWPDRARRAAVLLSGVSVQSDDGSITIQLLADIRTVFGCRGISRMHSEPLCEALSEMEDKPWGDWRNGLPISPHQLARLLKRHQIHPKMMRIGKPDRRGYDLDQFKVAFATYLPDETATPQQPIDFNELESGQSATQTATSAAESAAVHKYVPDRDADVADHVAVAEAKKYNENNPVADVAVLGEGRSEKPALSRIDLQSLLTKLHPPFPPLRPSRRTRGNRSRGGRKPSRRK